MPGADNTFDHRTRTKMEDQAHWEMGSFQVVEDLCSGNGVEYRTRFRFDDYGLLDHEVCLIDANRNAAVDQLIANQLLDHHATASKFDGESFPVGRFQKAEPQLVVDVNERLDDLPREVL
jgi:hypothetical protein